MCVAPQRMGSIRLGSWQRQASGQDAARASGARASAVPGLRRPAPWASLIAASGTDPAWTGPGSLRCSVHDGPHLKMFARGTGQSAGSATRPDYVTSRRRSWWGRRSFPGALHAYTLKHPSTMFADGSISMAGQRHDLSVAGQSPPPGLSSHLVSSPAVEGVRNRGR
jgi:hypothetical protein